MRKAVRKTNSERATQGEWVFVEGESAFSGDMYEPPSPAYPPSIQVENEHGEFEIAQLQAPEYRVEPQDEYDEGIRDSGDYFANGRIMAASKELLEALQAARPFVADARVVCGDMAIDPLLHEIDAAIRKAEGQ